MNDMLNWMARYKALIQEKESELAQLRSKLESLEAAYDILRAEGVGDNPLPLVAEASGQATGPYKGMGLVTSIKDILKNSDQPLSGAVIFEKLTKGGFTSNSANMRRDVYISLNRLRKRGDIQPIEIEKDGIKSYVLASKS